MDRHLQRFETDLFAAVEGIENAALLRHPEGKWCAAEVLEHLYLTYTGTIKGCERCLQKGKPLVSPATLRNRMAFFVVLKMGHLPSGRKAPSNTVPRGMPVQPLLEDIKAKLAAMDDMLAQCEAKFGARTRFLNHPVLGPLTATEWRKFHCIHGRHHIRQILALRGGA